MSLLEFRFKNIQELEPKIIALKKKNTREKSGVHG